MRYTDFLRTAVLLFGASATALGVVAIAGAKADDNTTLLYIALGWWVVSAAIGLWLGRRAGVTQAIGRLLSSARMTMTMPEVEPGRILFECLWLLAAFTVVAGALAFLIPQVPAVATGYSLINALAWRRQTAAVAAIEERDGVRFYVEAGSPFQPTRLIKTPWLRRLEPRREPAERAAG